jgi:hypothetical protein
MERAKLQERAIMDELRPRRADDRLRLIFTAATRRFPSTVRWRSP